MTRFRRPQATIGRSPYALRMTYPANITPENTRAIFREIQRWADALPLPNPGTFVPYFIEYAPEDPQEVWDENLVEILQTKFTTDVMPTGTWLVYAVLFPTEVPAGAVGIDANLIVNGPNVGIPGRAYESVGYMSSDAIRTVDDLTIDFTGETFELTYKWVLPEVAGSLTYPKPSSLNLVYINAADDVINIEGEARYASIVDETVNGDTQVDPVPSYLYVWAYRLSDGYNIPRSIENITPS